MILLLPESFTYKSLFRHESHKTYKTARVILTWVPYEKYIANTKNYNKQRKNDLSIDRKALARTRHVML